MSRVLTNPAYWQVGNTKIICTIGPSSESRGVIRKLLLAGMRGARLNFSHGTYQHHRLLVDNVRQVANELNIPCAIIADLQGPKIRVGNLSKPIELSKNEEIFLIIEHKEEKLLREREDVGKVIPVQYNLAPIVQKGDILLIDDGLIEIRVLETFDDYLRAKVRNSGPVGSLKGINIPGREIQTQVITSKDKQDLEFSLTVGVDAIALSFIESAKDIKELRRLVRRLSPQLKVLPLLIAKIERKVALEDVDNIIAEADAVMVARGDLGLEIPASDVPIRQKEIINKCLIAYKPVIVATQMLDSMIHNPRPTRAEVSDVAGAVVDHADALMLSAETAFGKYPVLACETMADIVRKIEKSPYDNIEEMPLRKGAPDEEALAHAAWSLSLEVKARAILATTITGKTARMIARFRPELPILVTCEDKRIQRQLILSWGIMPFILAKYASVDQLIEAAVDYVKKSQLVRQGEKVIILSGQPVGQGGTNLVKVHTI